MSYRIEDENYKQMIVNGIVWVYYASKWAISGWNEHGELRTLKTGNQLTRLEDVESNFSKLPISSDYIRRYFAYVNDLSEKRITNYIGFDITEGCMMFYTSTEVIQAVERIKEYECTLEKNKALYGNDLLI